MMFFGFLGGLFEWFFLARIARWLFLNLRCFFVFGS